MDINYELYKVFYYVATTLSFSEASKLLFISQSAVSQSIKVLEKKLGITLFIRSTKRVQLTPEGETLLRHVEPAINLIARGEAQIMEAGTLGGGQLRIGASDTICRYFLVPYLNRFHRSFPNVHIKVTNQTSTQCVDLLESGQVDFIVTNYPNSHLSSRLHTIPIHWFHDIFIANGEYYPELENRPVHLKELLQYPILMLDRKSTTSEFLHSQFQRFQLDLVLRNNITTPEHPLGVFHPHAKLHHIKKENIGLIEVMGLAVLPSRLKKELFELADALVARTPVSQYPEELQKHAEWAEDILARHPELNGDTVHLILQDEVGHVFAQVLADAGVYKMDEAGRAGFVRFLASVQ